ncbi:MAG: T9SS type A sorting domain-containing protein [candidate division KSB1 bacterium]|nr:T9SS type A sorting domain-containing protein [candidate division KSB1 bacterium]
MRKVKTWAFLVVPMVVLFLASSVILAKNNEGKGTMSLKKITTLDHKLIDVNQIAAWMSNDGILCSDPVTGQSGLYFPKGAPPDHTVIYTAGLWVVGKIGGDIRSAAADYATEFQPGMILGVGGPPDDPSDPKYKIFKFKAEEWDSPEMAADRAEAIAQGMEDKMYGDQMLYCVYNDYADHSGVWTKAPIGLEVQQLAFGFNRVGALGNTIFIKYTFINKGTDVLEDAYVAQFFDPDNGGASDDAVGCDTTLGIGYVYNMDNYDDVYGAAVPCFGCDFFQGPVVPSPGDTAYLPGQPPLPDHKVLQMTSFGPYINGGPEGMSDPRLQRAEGAQQAYWFCSGLKGNGAFWLDPTKGDAVTRWPFYGDPVTGTGWIQQLTWKGDDMRMSLASGPFTLEIGVPYSVVVGYVVGLGKDNLNSIEVMKSYDRSAQTAYDLNFEIAKPAPYPDVSVAELDRQIVLTWKDYATVAGKRISVVDYVAENKVDLDTLGNPSYYYFEGFKLYQGESAGGPWTLIKQWDKENGIKKIWDYVYDSVSGENIYSVVENGKDTGLTFRFVIDKDYIRNIPLVNGRTYYFSLTTYSYDEWGSPRVLENAIKTITAVPQKPILDTKLSSAPGDTIKVTHVGPSDGAVLAIVVDPTVVTGDSYKVTFSVDAEGTTLWKVTNVTKGEDVVTNLTHQAAAAVLATDEEFPVVDGVLVKVAGPPPGMKGWSYTPSANRWLTWAEGNLWELEGYEGSVGWGANFLNGSSVTADKLVNVELRFAASDTTGSPLDPNDPNISMAYRYMRRANAAPAKPEFAPFIINPSGGYPYQDMRPIIVSAWDIESSPPRRLAVAFLENNVAEGKVDGKWFPGRYDTEGGNNVTREFLYIFASDYSETPKEEYTTKNILNDQATMDIMWVSTMSRRGARVPQAGDKFTIFANHVNSARDVYGYSTKGLQKVVSLDVAKERLQDINVFPNPYFASNKAETDFFAQFVTFSNLPKKCTIRIFSLSGQMVKTIEHDAETPFERWNLQNEHGLPVASGMYIGLIEVPGVGEKILKIAIINREARYQHF